MPVWAQTPAPPPDAVKKITAGVANEVVDVSQSDSCSKDVDSCILRFVFGGGMKATDLKRPAFNLVSSMFAGLSRLLPSTVKTNTIPKNPQNNYTSGWASLYVKDPESGQEHCIGATEPYISEAIPVFSKLDADSRQVSSLMARYQVTGKGGSYDMREPAVEIAGPPPCTITDTAGALVSDATGIKTPGGTFASLVISFLKQVLSGGSSGEKVEAKIYSKQADNYLGRDYCLIAGCTDEAVDLSYVGGEEAGKVSQAGGVSRTFSPASHDPKGGNTHGESDSQFEVSVSGKGDTQVDTRTAFTKATECSTDYMALASLPLSLQERYVTKKPECSYAKKPAASEQVACGPEFDNLISSFGSGEAACRLCNTDRINAYADVDLPAGDLPPTMKKIIEKAADTYKVPASLIIGIMYNEGAFSRSQIQWTEENVRKWSCGQEKMPFCEDPGASGTTSTAWGTAQLPFGWIPKWFYLGEGTAAVWNAVSAVLPSKNSKEKISPCNFMDGVFATAKSLSSWSRTLPPDAIDHRVTQCRGYSMTNAASPGSCSGWTDAIAAQSRVGYAGYCPDPGKHNPAYPEGPFIEAAIERYQAFSCTK